MPGIYFRLKAVIKSPICAGKRHFQTGEWLNPDMHFHAKLGTSEIIGQALREEKYVLVIDHRQSGKTTAAKIAMRGISDCLWLELPHQVVWVNFHSVLESGLLKSSAFASREASKFR